MISSGAKGSANALVTDEKTAAAVGSGTLPVFATPCLAALMEQAAVSALQPFLGEGESSVGTLLHISHTAATPVGMRVGAEAEVFRTEGRRVFFQVSAWDESGPIGAGQHERVIVRSESFLEKAWSKKSGGHL
jgi:predicted thioesterase